MQTACQRGRAGVPGWVGSGCAGVVIFRPSLTRGGTYTESHTSVVPQAINWQAAYDDGTPHVATAWGRGLVARSR